MSPAAPTAAPPAVRADPLARRLRPLPVVLGLVLLGACASPDTGVPSGVTAVSAEDGSIWDDDLLKRLSESIARARAADRNMNADQREDNAARLILNLERLLPGWTGEQRDGDADALQRVLTVDVVTNFDLLLDTYEDGPRERRIVAAWALGFSRVPPNSLGIRSPHPRAVESLSDGLSTSDDDVMRNSLIALWLLADPTTPADPLLDIMVGHHDPEVRAMAALAVSTCLTSRDAGDATDSVLLAIEDSDPKVRLHAANIVRNFPQPRYTRRLETVITSEPMPLVRASMAAALGAAGQRSSAPALVSMLAAGTRIEATAARVALATIYGEDRGYDPNAWTGLLGG